MRFSPSNKGLYGGYIRGITLGYRGLPKIRVPYWVPIIRAIDFEVYQSFWGRLDLERHAQEVNTA